MYKYQSNTYTQLAALWFNIKVRFFLFHYFFSLSTFMYLYFFWFCFSACCIACYWIFLFFILNFIRCCYVRYIILSEIKPSTENERRNFAFAFGILNYYITFKFVFVQWLQSRWDASLLSRFLLNCLSILLDYCNTFHYDSSTINPLLRLVVETMDSNFFFSFEVTFQFLDFIISYDF